MAIFRVTGGFRVRELAVVLFLTKNGEEKARNPRLTFA